MPDSLLFNRQHSTTGHDLSMKKTSRPKYRRWSSADERNLDENKIEEKVLKEFDPVSSDNDSGIEDSDQQVAKLPTSQVREEQEEEEEKNVLTFEACEEDEDVIGPSTPTNTPFELDNTEQDFQRLLHDRKSKISFITLNQQKGMSFSGTQCTNLA